MMKSKIMISFGLPDLEYLTSNQLDGSSSSFHLKFDISTSKKREKINNISLIDFHTNILQHP